MLNTYSIPGIVLALEIQRGARDTNKQVIAKCNNRDKCYEENKAR